MSNFQQFKELIETDADDKQVKIYGMLEEKAERLFNLEDSWCELSSSTDDDFDTMEFADKLQI